MELTGRVVLITGSSSGIGKEAALRFARAGAKVVVNFKSNKAGADAVVKSIKKIGNESVAIQADVVDPAQVKKLFAAAVKKFGTVDILINNAGLATPKPFLEITREDLIKETEKNYFSQIYCAQEAAKIMQKKGSGKIINVSSICGITGCTTVLTFSAARGAVNILTKTLAKILAPDIQVNGVAPGYTLTRFWDGMTAKEISELLSETLTKQWVKPEEIADSFLYLVRNDSITGQILVVDGGYTTTI